MKSKTNGKKFLVKVERIERYSTVIEVEAKDIEDAKEKALNEADECADEWTDCWDDMTMRGKIVKRVCPKCGNEVIPNEDGLGYVDQYFCKRCNKSFNDGETVIKEVRKR